MKEQDLPFFRLSMSYSLRWGDHFRSRELSPEVEQAFQAETKSSLRAQTELEAAEDISFATYLENFYGQYRAL